MPDLTPEQFELLLEEEVATLEPEALAVLARFRVPAFRGTHEVATTHGREALPLWVVAQSGDEVLGYDETEDEYGTGRLRPDALVEDWGTYGEPLVWSLRHFCSS